MRAITVYRLDSGSNAVYRTRHPIGSVLEPRKHERVNNDNDLFRLARRLFALDTADTVHVVIDMSQARQACLPELTRTVRRGSPEDAIPWRTIVAGSRGEVNRNGTSLFQQTGGKEGEHE